MTSSPEHASPVGLCGQGCISSHSPKVRDSTDQLWPCLGDPVLGPRLLALRPLGEFCSETGFVLEGACRAGSGHPGNESGSLAFSPGMWIIRNVALRTGSWGIER